MQLLFILNKILFKGLFNLLPKEERQQKKKIIGYLSLYTSAAFSKAAKIASTITNKSFDTLPDDIKTKLLDFGNDINNSLRKLKVSLVILKKIYHS